MCVFALRSLTLVRIQQILLIPYLDATVFKLYFGLRFLIVYLDYLPYNKFINVLDSYFYERNTI